MVDDCDQVFRDGIFKIIQNEKKCGGEQGDRNGLDKKEEVPGPDFSYDGGFAREIDGKV